jgi:hypothetical protein
MNKTHQYRPVVYFVLAFAITWINGFILVVQSHQGGDKNIIFLLLAYMGPYIAALIMMFVFSDKAFRADFRKRIYNLRLIRKNYIPFTLFFLPVAMVISILISTVFGQPLEQLRFAEEFKVFDGEVILSMIILVLVPPLAIIMNYLYYKNRRSIFLVALFHILVNYSSELFEANQVSKCIFTLVLAVVAAIIVIRNKSFFFQDKMIDA